MASSRQKLIEDAVLTTVQALTLTDMPAGNITDMLDASDLDADKAGMPRIIVTHSNLTETLDPVAGTNASDDVVYPVSVYMLDRANQDQEAASGGDKWLYWRQLIARAFHNTRLSGISECFKCVVVPMRIHDQGAWGANLWLSGLTINVHCRVARS